MVTDLNQFKENILNQGESLMDKKLLTEDMQSIFDYYLDNPTETPNYLTEFFVDNKLKLMDFALAYLSNFVGVPLKLEKLDDGKLKIFK